MPPSTEGEGDRGALLRLFDLWGFGPGFGAPHRDVRLRAADDTTIAATYLPRPVGAPAVLLVPGFAAHRRKSRYVRLAQALAASHAVLVIDPRGHGGSSGACTLGDREVLDVAAGLAWLRGRGHPWVASVGASMGGTAVVRAAGSGPRPDAVCAISAPAHWGLDTSRPMRAIGRLPSSRLARTAWRAVTRVRVAPGWSDPPAPAAVAGRIAPTPLLVVHGDDDHFFGIDQAEALLAAAGPTATLWREPPGFGHAEDGFTFAFASRLAGALAVARAEGRWPDRVEEAQAPRAEGAPAPRVEGAPPPQDSPTGAAGP